MSWLNQYKTQLASYIADFLNVSTAEVETHLVISKGKEKRGEFALPCFPFSKIKGQPANQISESIASFFSDSKQAIAQFISTAQATGPYVNFFCNRSALIPTLLERLLVEGGLPWTSNKSTVILEYSSPNIAKVFHVGHLRTTLIGSALERALKHAGYNVITINHLGDWGTQFGFVWAGSVLFGQKLTSSGLNTNSEDFKLAPTTTVDDLVSLYVRANNLRKSQDVGAELPLSGPTVNEMARSFFLKLEEGEHSAVVFWETCLKISIEYFKKMYARLGVNFDYFTGESFYRSMLGEVEELIRKSGILQESDGALGVDLGEQLGFVRIFAEDGRSLYITRDIAAAIYRHNTFKPKQILYVVASQQSLHFAQLKGVLKKMDHPSADEIVHIPFGMVPGMSSRSGGAISLGGFLDEASTRALEVYRTEVNKRPEGLKEEDIAEKVAIGATYFYFLSHSNTKDFHFRWEEALNFKGDSGPYLQYALSRLNSIKDNAQAEGISWENDSPTDFSQLIESSEGYELLLHLTGFDETIEKVITNYELVGLAQYLLDLAKLFSKAYLKLRVIGEIPAKAKAHLALFSATHRILCRGLEILGVPLVERM
jgi:arginyl-tRNA synthetase